MRLDTISGVAYNSPNPRIDEETSMLKRKMIWGLMLYAGLSFSEGAVPLDKVVAVINDGVITESELDSQVEAFKSQVLAQNKTLPPEKTIKKQVLQHLIDRDLQMQLAKKNDINIEAKEIDDTIAKIAANNHLNLAQLRDALSQQGMDWDTYKENIRKELLISKVQQKAVGSKINDVTPEQVEDYLKTVDNKEDLSKRLYHVQNIVIPLSLEPSSEEVQNAQKKAMQLLAKIRKGADFTTIVNAESSAEFALEGGDLGERYLVQLPEIFAEKVKNMHVGEVAGPLRAGNGFQLIKLSAIGGQEEGHMVTKTHVRHILLKQDANTTTAEAQKSINNLYQQLLSGKDFAEMAKRYSLDTPTAGKGGDLGWVQAGELVPEFEKVMDALPLGKISHPVKTMYGWHLIQVLARKNEKDTESFKRQQARAFLFQRKFAEAVQDWQQKMRSDAYVNIVDKELA
jgi:peptidyl-prolyl cis-trans isomerase SurA